MKASRLWKSMKVVLSADLSVKNPLSPIVLPSSGRFTCTQNSSGGHNFGRYAVERTNSQVERDGHGHGHGTCFGVLSRVLP